METTTNNNIKIVRLQSGEDIIANYHADEENGVVMLDNPMHIIFKRIPTGQTVMMMMPWLPIELIKDNHALIYDSDILTIIEPKDNLISYYGNVVLQANERMDNNIDFNAEDDDEEDDDFDDEEITEEKLSEEEVFELLKEKKKFKLH
jgi:hypothetical protein